MSVGRRFQRRTDAMTSGYRNIRILVSTYLFSPLISRSKPAMSEYVVSEEQAVFTG